MVVMNAELDSAITWDNIAGVCWFSQRIFKDIDDDSM